jgi:hypothetical protein
MSKRIKDDIEGALIGAAAGAAVFYGIRGLAKLVTAPFRSSHHELNNSHARLSQHTVVTHHREVREVYIRKEPTTIDMGEVEQYDPYDINNLVQAQKQFNNNKTLITSTINSTKNKWQQKADTPGNSKHEPKLKLHEKPK